MQLQLLLLIAQTLILISSQKSDIKVVLPTCCDLKLSKSRNISSICNETSYVTGEGRNEINVPWEWDLPEELLGFDEVSKFLLNVKDLPCNSAQSVYLNYTFGDEDPFNPKLQIDSKGYVHWIKSRLEIDYYHINQYCIHGISNTDIIIKTCKPQCHPDEPCIRKCCPLNSVFNPQQGAGCMKQDLQWTPKFFQDPSNPNTAYDPIPIILGSPRYFTRAPPIWQENCFNGSILFLVYDQDVSQTLINSHGILAHPVKFRLGSNGKLNIRNLNSRKWGELNHENYCLDGLNMPGNYTITNGFKNTLEEQVMFICPIAQSNVVQKPIYYGGLAIFASTFALLTVITYFLLFEKQNIHGWTIMSHSSCVFLFFICIGIAHLTNTDKSNDPINRGESWRQIGCKINATLAHYLFISTFCWLLLISFDLWYTFRKLTAVQKGKGLRRFVYYSLFGWGLPFLTIGISWILEYQYKYDENSMVPVPLYGEGYCYVGNGSHLYYIYIPISILMGFNLLSFILASISLIRLQQSAKFARENINREKQSYLLFVKLFIVVGALWIFELISFYTSGGHIEWYWQIFDSLNLLQPVAIFWIFVLKWEMINALHTKYKFLRPFLWPIRQILLFLRDESSSRLSFHPKRKSNITLKSSTEPRVLSSKM